MTAHRATAWAHAAACVAGAAVAAATALAIVLVLRTPLLPPGARAWLLYAPGIEARVVSRDLAALDVALLQPGALPGSWLVVARGDGPVDLRASAVWLALRDLRWSGSLGGCAASAPLAVAPLAPAP